MNDGNILDDAKAITQSRENVHGSIVETHQAIADFWTAWLRAKYGAEFELTPGDAADMLDLFKDARKATGEDTRDTYVDAAGYNHCGWVCREWENEQ